MSLRLLSAASILAAACLVPSARAQLSPLPPSPSVQLAVDPIANKVYAANKDAGTVTALDATTGTSTSIAVGNSPDFIAVDPTRGRVYVNTTRDASLTVIDGTANAVIAPYAIGSMGPIAINPDPSATRNIVYIVRMTSAGSDEVTFFSPASPTWYTIATNSFQPGALAVNPATHTIFVTHYATGDVRIINGEFDGVDFPPSTSLGMWSKPFAVVANPVTNKAYVITEDSRGPIAVVDGATKSAVFPAVTSGHASGPRAVAVNPVTNRIYAAFAGEVIVIDGSTNALTYIPIANAGSGAISLGINYNTNRIYAATALGTLSIIDGASNTVESSQAIATGTSSIGINPVTNTVYLYANGITALAGAAGSPQTIPLTTTIAALPGNSSGPSGSILLQAASRFAPTALPVRKVYFRIDSTNGPWTEAPPTGTGSYTASFSSLAAGSHTLYAMAVDDQVVPLSTGPQSIPLVGQIAAYAFSVTGSAATPSLSLASSSNPSRVGDTVTFTASIAGSAGTPTGTIAFVDGASNVCASVALASGTATCTTSALSSGSHTISARYSGDSNYATASASIAQVVNPAKVAPTSINLTSSANPSAPGQSVTFALTVRGSAGAPTGTANFRDGATVICANVALTGGGDASCTTATLASGTHSVVADYSGDTNYNGASSNTVTQAVKGPATLSLTSSANPSASGQSVTFTLAASGSAGTPGGSVTFKDGTTTLCTVGLASGSAVCATTSLAAGTHSVRADYSGDSSYVPSSSTTLSQFVKAAPTFTLASSANPSIEGQAVTFTASVSGAAGTASGTISLTDGGAPISGCTSIALSAGSATCSAPSLVTGPHSIAAQYSGDSAYGTASASLTQTVNARGAPALALVSSANPSNAGQSVTFTLTASGGSGPPTGAVTFKDGSATLCATTLTSGSASCPSTSLTAGTHSVRADYAGDANYTAGSSNTVAQLVKASATLSLASSVNPSTQGQAVSLSASVSGASGTPTGTVSFTDGGSAIAGCTALALSGGGATCTTAALATGSRSILAQYSGDGTYLAASGSLTQAVKAVASTSLSVSANPSTAGQTVSFTASVSGTAGTPTGTVSFNDGSNVIAGCGAVALSGGNAVCTTSSLSAGTHAIVARYAGDSTYVTATSSALSQSVSKSSVTTTLSSSANPSTPGQSVTFTATLSGGFGPVTGTVAFLDGGLAIAGCSSVAIGVGGATCTTAALSSGTHSIAVQYAGDANYAAATSASLSQGVSVPAKANANVTLASSSNPGVAGDNVTFTASIAGSAGSPTGTVSFTSDAIAIAGCTSIAVSGGAAACATAALSAGTHQIVAQYSGDAVYNAATSSTLTQATVAPAPQPAADLSISQAAPSSALVGDDIAIDVTIVNAGPNAATGVTSHGAFTSGVTVISVPGGCSVDSGGTIFCRFFDFAANESRTVRFVLRASAAGTITSTLEVGANEHDPASGNNSSALTLTANSAPQPSPAPAPSSTLANISTRGLVGSGNNVLIAGFIIGGAANKTVAVTVAGPSIANYVTAPLANPTLTLVRMSDGAVIGTNDDWQSASNAADIRAAGFAPADPRESAIMMSLPPGAYTAIVSGAGGTTGNALVGVFEVDHPEVPLINISTRGQVLTGNDVMIGGFIIQGSTPQSVVITGSGPSLASAGIANPLANPMLTLVRMSDGAVIATNDDWQQAPNASEIRAAGLDPGDPKESAILVSLEPGAYTAILSGVNGGAGVGMVAVYRH